MKCTLLLLILFSFKALAFDCHQIIFELESKRIERVKIIDELFSKLQDTQAKYINGSVLFNAVEQQTKEYLKKAEIELEALGLKTMMISPPFPYYQNNINLPVLVFSFKNSDEVGDSLLNEMLHLQKEGDLMFYALDPNLALSMHRGIGGAYVGGRYPYLFFNNHALTDLLNKGQLRHNMRHEINHALLDVKRLSKDILFYHHEFNGADLTFGLDSVYKRYFSAEELHNYSKDPLNILRNSSLHSKTTLTKENIDDISDIQKSLIALNTVSKQTQRLTQEFQESALALSIENSQKHMRLDNYQKALTLISENKSFTLFLNDENFVLLQRYIKENDVDAFAKIKILMEEELLRLHQSAEILETNSDDILKMIKIVQTNPQSLDILSLIKKKIVELSHEIHR